MIFEQHYLDCLSQASYFIGDETSGRAVVVDPRRDIAPYMESATEHDMSIELVLETHFHADFLSGHLELAQATGATIAYGDKAVTEFDSRKLAHGERISLGEVELEIRHTPGHTPESISIVVYEKAGDAEPYAVLTGDTLFIGDVGRPDLLSSKGVTSEELASQLYDSLHQQLMTLPDSTRVYPAHGAGSACGKNLSTETSSTIGDQRTQNYALAPMDRDGFIAVVTEGQTAPPAYFAYDAVLNRENRPIFDETVPPNALTLAEVVRAQRQGAIVLDTRDPNEFSAGHLIGSINVGLAGRYAEFAGGVIQPGVAIVLVADEGEEMESKIRLARIGFDNVIGYLDNPLVVFNANLDDVARSSRVDVAAMQAAMDRLDCVQVVDVRQPGETTGGVIPGAQLIPLTTLNKQLASLDASKPTIVYCAGGYRSSIAASSLAAAGFRDVSDLLGGFGAWEGAGAPVAGRDGSELAATN
ncbi:MAG: MBL fold metallo-hydrolase [Acidimicrobiia bacterium]|nr:MBL fold metallo-hydrolase [Acidimicrobiia bacterium]MDH5520238.1 MBL fold metallo-hydrolase [Acidimicrobiia bacterium]